MFFHLSKWKLCGFPLGTPASHSPKTCKLGELVTLNYLYTCKCECVSLIKWHLIQGVYWVHPIIIAFPITDFDLPFFTLCSIFLFSLYGGLAFTYMSARCELSAHLKSLLHFLSQLDSNYVLSSLKHKVIKNGQIFFFLTFLINCPFSSFSYITTSFHTGSFLICPGKQHTFF